MKIWSQVYTDTEPNGAGAATTNSNGVITIPSGQAALVKVNFPYEARIGRIVCKQLSAGRSGGTAVAFKFAIYNRQVVPVGVGAAQATLPDNAPLFEQYQLQQTNAGTTLQEFTPKVGGDGYLFSNRETGQTVRTRACYVYIQPVAAGGPTKWEFALDALIEIGM